MSYLSSITAALMLLLSLHSYSQYSEPIATTNGPTKYAFWLGCQAGYRLDISEAKGGCHFGVEKNIVKNFTNLVSVGGNIHAHTNSSFSIDGYVGFAGIVRLGTRYNTESKSVDFAMGARMPVFGNQNASLMVNYIPSQKYIEAGVVVNLGRRKSHKKKKKVNYVLQRSAIPRFKEKIDYSEIYPGIDIVDELEIATHALYELKNPSFDLKFKDNKEQDLLEVKKQYEQYRDKFPLSFEIYSEIYHEMIKDGFNHIVKNLSDSQRIYEAALASLSQEILIPLNSRFGMEKKNNRKKLFFNANSTFYKGLVANISLSEKQLAATMAFYNQILLFHKKELSRSKRKGKNSRDLWVPMNSVLTVEKMKDPQVYKTYFSKLIEEDFTSNKVSYLIGESWYEENMRAIHEAKSFHGILIHDIQGENVMNKGETDDSVSWRLATDGYLAAQLRNLKMIASGELQIEDIPRYFIFLDSFYYENTKPENIFKILRNPLDDEIVNEVLEGVREPVNTSFRIVPTVKSYLRQIKEVVESSNYLSSLDRDELSNLLRIHVNITYPYDTSLFSQNIMTDHRKVFFKDLGTPGSEMASFGGMGFGELYNGPNWEDRGLKIEGMAARSLKKEIWDIIVQHKIDQDPKLITFFKPTEQDQIMTKSGSDELAVTFNRIDYDKKMASVGRAYQFDMMERGGLLVIPDSLWLADYWMNIMFAASARGVKIKVLMNATKNFVSPFIAVKQKTREIFLKFFYLSNLLKNDGNNSLDIGIYNSKIAVGELQKKLEKVTSQDKLLVQAELPHFNLMSAGLNIAEDSADYLYESEQEEVHPFMHLKMNLYLSPDSLEQLRNLDMSSLFENYFQERSKQVSKKTKHYDGIKSSLLLNDDYEVLTESVMSHMIGSQNMDNRGQYIDAETGVFSLGPSVAMYLPDFYMLMGLSLWPTTYQEIDENLLYQGEFGEFITKLMKGVI